VVIADLLDLFTQDPNIDHNEAIFLIKEIINSIKKILAGYGPKAAMVSQYYINNTDT
jgi:ABC-type uncharacterized transport system substrate-binding protein